MTHRQYLTWLAWLELRLEDPGLIEWLLMQLTAEMRRSWVKNKNSPRADQFKMKFKSLSGAERGGHHEESKEEVTRKMVAYVAALAGGQIMTEGPDGQLVPWDMKT